MQPGGNRFTCRLHTDRLTDTHACTHTGKYRGRDRGTERERERKREREADTQTHRHRQTETDTERFTKGWGNPSPHSCCQPGSTRLRTAAVQQKPSVALQSVQT